MGVRVEKVSNSEKGDKPVDNVDNSSLVFPQTAVDNLADLSGKCGQGERSHPHIYGENLPQAGFVHISTGPTITTNPYT
jgi:hypothetical protein